eukprot:COSAG06_NODE_8341_length_2199_cov_1.301905_3_plen_66_part_00
MEAEGKGRFVQVPLLKVPRAGHCKLIDEPQFCCEAMAKFLDMIESMRASMPPPTTVEIGTPDIAA